MNENNLLQTLTGSRNIHEFNPIQVIPPASTFTVTLGVDFADTIQPIEFTVISSLGNLYYFCPYSIIDSRPLLAIIRQTM